MTPNKVIYHVQQEPQLSKIWAELPRKEREDVVRRMENQTLLDLEKVLIEIQTGQNRLF